jgi:hypothetical protein
MKHIVRRFLTRLLALLFAAAAPNALAEPPHRGPEVKSHQGHHQSGIVGSVSGGIIIATPTGEGSAVLPNIVRVYTATFPHKLVAEAETEVQGDAWWHFEVCLKPDDYLLVASTSTGQLFSYPVPVTVEKRQWRELAPIYFAPQ